MEATLTSIGVTDARTAQFVLAAAAAVLRAFRQLGAAIVAGSDHPVFRTPDSASSLVLASRTEQNRLLDAGFYSDHR
jgi:imidazolonepropionase-like amidohydrolase